MKAHQRIIREKKAKEPPKDLFGAWWENIDTNIKKAVCKEIDYNTAKTIILEYEWLGTMGITQYHYGIYFEGYLAGVICFGMFQAMRGYANFVGEKYAKKGIQLSRGACVHWAHKHSASKLIAYGLKEMKKKGYKYVIAFSDEEAGEIGTVYQATNWYYIGKGKTRHAELYCKKTGKKIACSQDIYKKGIEWGDFSIDNYDKEKYFIKRKIPKGRYIKLIGSKQDNKNMYKVLKEKIQPYPKRNKETNNENNCR